MRNWAIAHLAVHGFLWFAIGWMHIPNALAQQKAVTPSVLGGEKTSGTAQPPYGWVDFCKRHAKECEVDIAEPKTIILTEKIWNLLIAVNIKTNKDIEHQSDMDHWGIVDRWDLAEDGKGDTEDYVNLKKRRLVDAGLPRRALLTTVVIDDKNDGHAVLTVRTDRGDFILDNNRNKILRWDQTGYTYIKRESQDKSAWVGLGNLTGKASLPAR